MEKVTSQIVGYARVSTMEQSLDVQLEQLRNAGCTKIFQEKASGVDSERIELAALIDYVRAGDVVVITKMDRVARSTKDMINISDKLESKKVGLKILAWNGQEIITTSASGKMMLVLFAGIAEFERNIMLERQREGIARAKAEGVYKGRQATAKAKSKEVLELLSRGLTKEAVAKKLGIGVASVYRIAKDSKG